MGTLILMLVMLAVGWFLRGFRDSGGLGGVIAKLVEEAKQRKAEQELHDLVASKQTPPPPAQQPPVPPAA